MARKRYIQGKNRHQVEMEWRSMDDRVAANNEVRVIDAFVDSLLIGEMGFDVADDSDEDDGGLIFTAYNIRRLLNILSPNALIVNLESTRLAVYTKTSIHDLFIAILAHQKTTHAHL